MSAAPADLNGSLQGWGQVANVLATLLIGYIAFKVAVQSKGIAAASILPFLVVDEELYADRLCWNIKNVGLGPAIIKQVEVTYPAEPYIVRCVKELAASDRQKLETFLNHPAVNALAGGKHQHCCTPSWQHIPAVRPRIALSFQCIELDDQLKNLCLWRAAK